MFQIKDFASIAASVLNYARAIQTRITDFSVGSVARTLMESPSIEIEELYQQMFFGLQEAIPTAIYTSFDFARLPAVPATGYIRVSITASASGTTIPAGTVFTSPNYSTAFASNAEVTIAAGNTYADAAVTAKTAGASGNVAAGASFSASPGVSGGISAVALAGFTTGRDPESDEQRKARFGAYILSLARGTVSALRYGLSLVKIKNTDGEVVESVRHAAIIEPYKTDPAQPIALVNIYIHNGVDGASGDLIAEAAKIIEGYTDDRGEMVPGWKAAGVKVVISAASQVDIDVVGVLTIDGKYPSAQVEADVESAISDYIAALDVNGDVLVSEIIAAAMNVPGVVDFALTTPSANVAIGMSEKAAVGSFTFS